MTATCTYDGPSIVTVVMPCYNASATLVAAIESVRAQTMGAWQLIIVDDGSQDASVEIVRSFARRDPRIALVQQENSGPSTARNRGARASSTPFVAFLDSNDIWHEEHLAIHVAALGISFSRCRIVAENGAPTGEYTRAWASDVNPADILGCNPTSTCSSIVARREVFNGPGYMREDMIHAEDQEWLFRVAVSGWKLRGVEAATVLYRTSANGLSADTARMYEGWRTFLRHAADFAPDLVAEHVNAATAAMNLYYARRLIRTRQPGYRARRHLADAIRSFPAIILQRPVAVAAIAVASVVPWAAEFAILTLRSLRHA